MSIWSSLLLKALGVMIMGFFSKKMPSNIVFERMLKNLQVSCDMFRQPVFLDNHFVHIPIWYEFKNGTRIDLNNPSLIIEDWSGNYERLRQKGLRKILEWKKLCKDLPTRQLAVPNIVFYE